MSTQGNRGMALEEIINWTNQSYLQRNMAVVHKRPTPVHIVKTKGTHILSAYLESKSTVDYEGVYHGRSLQFEAKSTKQEQRFDLDNVHEHQVQHMRACVDQGAICFVILEFSRRHETFFLPAKMLFDAWDLAQNGGRKSIPYDDINLMCYLIRSDRGVPLDYLSVVDKLLEKAVG